MKIITFNIRCCDDPNGHSIDERAPRLKAVLDKHSPDIIGFQEARPQWMNYIEEYFSENYYIFNKYRDTSNWLESAPICYKKDSFNCIDKGYFWYSETPWVESPYFEKDQCKRICEWILLEYKETGKRFYYYNTHFGFGEKEQVMSAELLIKTADAMNAQNAIITGDFNITPDAEAYAQMVKSFTDVNAVTANYKGTTYHEYGCVSDQHIDYCFYRGDSLKPLSYTLLDDTFDGKYPSDHYGILIEFED